MAVEFQDYCAALGVSRDASDAEIKKAFRTMARKYHPDVAKDKKSAEEKFKQIVVIAELVLRVLKQMDPRFPKLSFDLKAISIE